MSSIHEPIRALITHVESAGQTTDGRHRAARWIQLQTQLADWETPGELAAACRAATGPDQDRLLGSLMAVGAGDELAQLTAVAGLADRLDSVVAGWQRAGAVGWELADLAAELVSECWAAVTTTIEGAGDPPYRLAWHLVDEARERVRVPRRRERRQSVRRVSIHSEPLLPDASEPPVEDRLATAIADAVRTGRITRAAAGPVFLTRVVGFPVAEAAIRLGCTPSVVRAVRSRAERRLVAA